MRISDLSRKTGVPTATIKFYLREGLLPPGRPTARNQADYLDSHRCQLELIRALTTIGGLNLSAVRGLLDVITDDDLPLPALYATVNRTVHSDDPAVAEAEVPAEVRADVDAYFAALGWEPQDAPDRQRVAVMMAVLNGLGCTSGMEFFLPHARAAEELAARELDLLPPDGAGASRGAAVLRAVIFGEMLASLRRLAQEHEVAQRFGDR
jgi:DNA-binding transcriptional MerR regulator